MKRIGLEGWHRIRWGRVLLSAGLSLILTAALTGAFAGLTAGRVMEESWLRYAAAAVILLSSFLGGGMAGAGIQDLAALDILYWMALLGMHMILTEGPPKGILVTAIAIAGGSTASYLVTHPGRKVSRHRSYRRKIR